MTPVPVSSSPREWGGRLLPPGAPWALPACPEGLRTPEVHVVIHLRFPGGRRARLRLQVWEGEGRAPRAPRTRPRAPRPSARHSQGQESGSGHVAVCGESGPREFRPAGARPPGRVRAHSHLPLASRHSISSLLVNSITSRISPRRIPRCLPPPRRVLALGSIIILVRVTMSPSNWGEGIEEGFARRCGRPPASAAAIARRRLWAPARLQATP